MFKPLSLISIKISFMFSTLLRSFQSAYIFCIDKIFRVNTDPKSFNLTRNNKFITMSHVPTYFYNIHNMAGTSTDIIDQVVKEFSSMKEKEIEIYKDQLKFFKINKPFINYGYPFECYRIIVKSYEYSCICLFDSHHKDEEELKTVMRMLSGDDFIVWCCAKELEIEQ